MEVKIRYFDLFVPIQKDYLEKLKERGKESRVYRDFQALGLEIAEILGDRSHRALYIKLAKMHDAKKLLALAKDVAERKHIKNKGAYFMSLVNKKPDDTASSRNNKYHE